MELIGYYVLFAFTTSLTACYLWFWPLVQEATSKEIYNTFTLYPVLSCIIYILISAVVAPALILPLISETMAQKFITGIRREIFKPD